MVPPGRLENRSPPFLGRSGSPVLGGSPRGLRGGRRRDSTSRVTFGMLCVVGSLTSWVFGQQPAAEAAAEAAAGGGRRPRRHNFGAINNGDLWLAFQRCNNPIDACRDAVSPAS